jgi:hypothetical protein
MAKHKAREAAKSLAGVQKEAANITQKLTPVLASIEALEDGPEYSLVAAPLTEPLVALREKMEAAMASAVVTGQCTDIGDVPEGMATIKQVMDWIATSRKTTALITSMLAMIAKAGR